MKHFKIIGLVLLFFFAFTSRKEQTSIHRLLTGLEIQQAYSKFDTPDFRAIGSLGYNKSDMHPRVKKKVKFRATTSESFILKTVYLHELTRFFIFKNSLIYGIGTIYQVQRHTYLHLYQLF